MVQWDSWNPHQWACFHAGFHLRSSFLLMCTMWAAVMTQVLGPLPLMWGTQIKFLASSFSLIQAVVAGM